MSSQSFSIAHRHVRMGVSESSAAAWPPHTQEASWMLRSEPLAESDISSMGVSGLIGVGATLGIVHVLTGPDHMSALAQLSVGSRVKGFWLGIRWGLGHSAGLLIMYDVLALCTRARVCVFLLLSAGLLRFVCCAAAYPLLSSRLIWLPDWAFRSAGTGSSWRRARV